MSKKGTSTFVMQRASAVVLLPLAIWLLFNIVTLLGGDYETARAWMSRPLNGVLLGAFVVVAAMHMRIGMTEIIADYIHSWLKDVFYLLNWIVALGAIAAAVWAVYAVSLAG